MKLYNILALTTLLSLGISTTAEAQKHDNNSKEKNTSVLPEQPPEAPCDIGSCATTIPVTHLTQTEIVTNILTFIYHDGQLIDVKLNENRTKKPQT